MAGSGPAMTHEASRSMTRIPIDPDAIRMLAVRADGDRAERDRDRREGQPHPRRARRGFAATVAVPQPALAAAASQRLLRRSAGSSEAELAAHPGAVASPMVGVAYLSPEPGSPPFATVGQPVTAGQTLLLIEAMKTFNQIKAPKSGTLARVLVTNGAPVEYGEVLMIVES